LQNDFDRPLNERGKKDAPKMANRLIAKKYAIDAFVSSPALRAKTTAILFAKEFDVLSDEIIFVPELYHAPAEMFFEVIKQLPNELKAVAVFSHNPGITNFVNRLTGSMRIDDMPTCSVFAVTYSGNWNDFEKGKKEFLFFDWPQKNQ
jgi:phosphohistidine phosphatase